MYVYAGTVFAYGVTSSGKTHTMHVSAELPQIFSYLALHSHADIIFLYCVRIASRLFLIPMSYKAVWCVPQGEQKSPGIIPLAVKDVFGIIQEVMCLFIQKFF